MVTSVPSAVLYGTDQVHGIIRRSSSFNTGRIAHLFDNPVTHSQKSTIAAFKEEEERRKKKKKKEEGRRKKKKKKKKKEGRRRKSMALAATGLRDPTCAFVFFFGVFDVGEGLGLGWLVCAHFSHHRPFALA